MKKRILSMLLAAVMVVGLMAGMSLTASAAAEHSHEGWTGIDDLSEITGAGNYYLADDITSTSSWTVNYDINLCLNGHKLRFTATSGSRYITVNSGKTLSVYDCSDNETGVIVSEMGSYTIYNKGTVNLYSGTVDYTAPNSNIAAVENCSGATFNMYGGKLDSVYHAIRNKGTVNISGGTVIADNDAIQADAGEVSISGSALVTTASTSTWATVNLYGGTFNIKGGTVTSGNGRIAIQAPSGTSVLNISGGTVTTSGKADTIYLLSANVDVTISGGSITNTYGSVSYSSTDGKRWGWAIDVINAKSLTISGAPTIDSIYLAAGKTITVGEGGLSNTTPIGVYCRTCPAAVTGTNNADYSSKFTPKENYAGTYVVYNTDENVIMFAQLTSITGTVAIDGTAEAGQTLTAVYIPGVEGETVSYQWYRDGAAINGATGAEYTVVKEDCEKTLKVVVAGTGLYKDSKETSVEVAEYKVPPVVVGDFTIAPTDGATGLTEETDYSYASGKLTVSTTIPVTIGMKDGVTKTEDIIVADSTNGEAAITLNGINIETTADEAITVKGGNETTFTFSGTNTIKSASDGIEVASNTPLVITSMDNGKLRISNVTYGISQDGYSAGGSLSIEGSIDLDISGCTSHAVYYRNTGSVTVSETPVINIDTKKYAIYAHGITISGGTITIKNDDGRAICGASGSDITISGSADVHILEGDGGVQTQGGKVTLTDSAKLKIYGGTENNKTAGIVEYAITSAELLIEENAVVDVFTQENAIGGGVTTITDNAQVNIKISSTSTSSRYALRFDSPLNIKEKAKVDIDISGSKIYGLYDTTDGVVNISDSAVVTIKGAYRSVYADNLNLSGKASMTITDDVNYAIYGDGAVTIQDSAKLTATSTEKKVLNIDFTVKPAEGKAYVVKYGASEAEAETKYYTEETTESDKSAWRYFHAEATDIIPVTITGVEVADKVYDGSAVSYTGTPKAMNGSTEVTGLSYTYTWYKDSSVTEANKLDEAPDAAGNYVLVVAVDGGAYIGQQEIRFTIEPKKIDIPAQPDAVTYNGASQTYGVTATADYTVTGGVQTDANETGYDVTISLVDKNNTCWEGGTTGDLTHKFIINKKTVTITAGDKSAYAGSKQPELTYSVSGLVGGDTLTTLPTLTTDAIMSTVGEYTITATGAAAGSNYTITYVPGKLTVSQVPITLYAINKAECENGKVTAQAIMAAAGSTVKVSAVPAEGYKVVSLTVTDASGNEIEVVDGKIRMPASDVTVSAVFVYDLPYIDVADDSEHYQAIAYMYVHGLMVGTSTEEYIFDGDLTMTRAQIAQILYSLAGEPAVEYTGVFTDVSERAWYSAAVEWAAAEGIVSGVGSDQFAPDRTITTVEMAALVYRYAQCEQGNECETSDWLTESAVALAWCVDNGILTDASAPANRYLAAEMFYRVCLLLNK